MRNVLAFRGSLFSLMVFLLSGSGLMGQKLTVEEVITRHLSAVGAGAVTRKTSNIQGRGKLQILVGGRAALTGPFYLQSRDKEFSYLLHFNISDYEHERLIANSEEADLGFITPGAHSPLGDFLYVHKLILREGLWGGVLSTAYPLFDIAFRQPKLKYAGLKKERGRKLHRIDYTFKRPQGSLKVRLFFDPDTFSHVRTSYRLVRPAPLAANTIASARLKSTLHHLTEDFEDFREEGGMLMPHRWTVRYLFDATDETISWEWQHELLAFEFDGQLDEAVFSSVAASQD